MLWRKIFGVSKHSGFALVFHEVFDMHVCRRIDYSDSRRLLAFILRRMTLSLMRPTRAAFSVSVDGWGIQTLRIGSRLPHL